MRWSLVVLAACGGAPARPHATATPDEALFYRGADAYKAHDWAAARALYTRLVSTYPQSRFRDQAVILLADLAFDDNQLESARTQYESVHVKGDLAQYVHYRHAWTDYDLGMFDAAVAELADLIGQSRGVLHDQAVVDLAGMRYRRADELYAQHDFCEAAPLFADVARADNSSRTDEKQRDEAGYAHVLATLSCEHLDDAKADGGPAWDRVLAAIDLYLARAKEPMPAVRYKRAQILYAAARYHDAATEFRRILKESPHEEVAPYAAALLLDSDNQAHDDVTADLPAACAIHAPDLDKICAR